ncbi:uncharacterized protein [Diadema setosum]|uniref:uncharacterized protein n=1 Tax=Diadema setosum TaxID=31175 RepID=UPI003B3B8C81
MAACVILAISVDRYIAITRPLRYVNVVTTKRVKVVIASSWILHVSVISLGINSAVNPLIYGYRDRLFRKAFSDLRRRLMTFIL